MSIIRDRPTTNGLAPESSRLRTFWVRYRVAADLLVRGFEVAPPAAHILADSREFSLRVAVQIAKYRDLPDGTRRYRADWRRAGYADVIALVDPDDGQVLYVHVGTRTVVDVRVPHNG